MNKQPTIQDLSEFFETKPEYDSPEDKDWSDFFANVHFIVARPPLKLVFSRSEAFGDIQVLLYCQNALISETEILNPLDLVLSNDKRLLSVVVSQETIVNISVLPTPSVSLFSNRRGQLSD